MLIRCQHILLPNIRHLHFRSWHSDVRNVSYPHRRLASIPDDSCVDYFIIPAPISETIDYCCCLWHVWECFIDLWQLSIPRLARTSVRAGGYCAGMCLRAMWCSGFGGVIRFEEWESQIGKGTWSWGKVSIYTVSIVVIASIRSQACSALGMLSISVHREANSYVVRFKFGVIWGCFLSSIIVNIELCHKMTRLSLRARRCDIRDRIKRGKLEKSVDINILKRIFKHLFRQSLVSICINISSWAL